MNSIEHIFEPQRLWLIWQSPEGSGLSRVRKTVAEIQRNSHGEMIFRYLKNTPDLEDAIQAGFKGFPAFRLKELNEFNHEVLEAFIRRLPPRSREDFCDYLRIHRLPCDDTGNFPGSDMALLAYTRAKLPGDGFEIAADFSIATPPLELVLEVAGFRYQNTPISSLSVGDRVQFELEPDNDSDANAIAIMHSGNRIGYISRPYLSVMHNWLNNFQVKAVIERLNGNISRPLIYIFVTVR